MKITIVMVMLFTFVVAPMAYSQNFGLPAPRGNVLDEPAPKRQTLEPELPGYPQAPVRSMPTNSAGNSVDLGICVVTIMEKVEVPARTSGSLLEFKLRRGTVVKKHALLASIDNRTAVVDKEYALEKKELAEFQARATEALQLAEATHSFANQRLSNNQKLYSKGAVTSGELDESRLAQREAQLAVQKAMHDRKAAIKMARLEAMGVKVADEKLQQHYINAPFDGNVLEVHKAAGEWVNEGDVIADVVRMDKLQVQGSFSASEYNPSELMGRPVTIVMQVARGKKETFTGKIYSVGLEQSASRKYKVWAEIENRRENGQWILRPKAEVTMYADLNGI